MKLSKNAIKENLSMSVKIHQRANGKIRFYFCKILTIKQERLNQFKKAENSIVQIPKHFFLLTLVLLCLINKKYNGNNAITCVVQKFRYVAPLARKFG